MDNISGEPPLWLWRPSFGKVVPVNMQEENNSSKQSCVFVKLTLISEHIHNKQITF